LRKSELPEDRVAAIENLALQLVSMRNGRDESVRRRKDVLVDGTREELDGIDREIHDADVEIERAEARLTVLRERHQQKLAEEDIVAWRRRLDARDEMGAEADELYAGIAKKIAALVNDLSRLDEIRTAFERVANEARRRGDVNAGKGLKPSVTWLMSQTRLID